MPDTTDQPEAAPPRRLCPGCGVVAPAERRTCEWCDGALDEPLAPPAADSDAYPVAVRCDFQCRTCGHLSPLNALDLDGTVRCLRCGQDQVFDVEGWSTALDHAHAVGDLAGPGDEGRQPHPRVSIAGDNPFAAIGRYRTSARHAQSGTRMVEGMVMPRSLRIDAAPGHPLCRACATPLSWTRGGGGLTTTCGDCGRTARYELDPRAPRLSGGLLGVIADEQRRDRPAVQLAEGSGGAAVMRCPGCGAALEDASDGASVRCGFCQTVARVPGAIRQRVFDHAPEAETWWLLFRGVSTARRDLEECDDLSDEALADLESPPMEPAHLFFRLILGTVVPAIALIATLILLWGTRLPPWLF